MDAEAGTLKLPGGDLPPKYEDLADIPPVYDEATMKPNGQ